MKVSREQRQANRCRILEAAGGLFREKGFEAVSVAEVMKVAGLTHGGFYGHFASKDDLIVQAIAHMFDVGPPEPGPGGLEGDLDAYLSPLHRDNVAHGCPTAALIADARRQTPAARLAMTEGFRSQVDRIAMAISRTETAEARREAIGIWASMVGALVLSRTIEDPELSDKVLRDTRAWIGERRRSPRRTASDS